jgi:hypothetical protein
VLTPRRPYANAEIITLHVGSYAIPFHVHGFKLAESRVLASRFDPISMTEQHVAMPEIDEPTAHTLVDYLYTGRYDDLFLSSAKSALPSYKLGTCVYCAAVRYQLPGLAELSKEKIVSLSDGVSISDILGLARDHALAVLPDNETWYPCYVEDAVKRAMAKDPEPFRRPEFITQVEGNTRLLQIVWKTVMSNFARTPVVPEVQDDTVSISVVDASANDAVLVDEAEPASEKSDQAESSSNHNTDTYRYELPTEAASETPPVDITSTSGLSIEDIFDLNNSDSVVDTTQELETFEDEPEPQSSKTDQEMNIKDHTAEPIILALSDPEREAHKRSDSVMHAEIALTTPVEDEADKMMTADDKAAVLVNGGDETYTWSKKSKKKNKKKSAIVF